MSGRCFFNDAATTEIYTLSLRDALPIVGSALLERAKERRPGGLEFWVFQRNEGARRFYERHRCVLVEMTDGAANRSEEHTSELQSRQYLVCRLLLEKKTTHRWYATKTTT